MTIYFALVYFSLVSCGPSVAFTGKRYAPTSHVDVYFHAADVKKSYEIMGKSDGRAWLLTDYDKIRKHIVKEAKKKGADGVIFTGISDELVGTPYNNTADSSTGQQVRTVVHADFIKYH